MYDYYKILEIPHNASLEEIKRAYRIKAKTVHPDINNSPKANEVFALVNEAYETLLDKHKRYLHDIKLNNADDIKLKAGKKKQYYGSSVKNSTYTNAYGNGADFHYNENGFGKPSANVKDDKYYYNLSPILYNMLFVCGMFLGFIIAIVTIAGTFKNYWPKPFIFISVLGFILIIQGWRGIMGKKTIIDSLKKGFRK